MSPEKDNDDHAVENSLEWTYRKVSARVGVHGRAPGWSARPETAPARRAVENTPGISSSVETARSLDTEPNMEVDS